MYVRLAFAVAAHLEPDILIIDEVLAVGDAEFQKKCLGKMKDVSGQGRTVLFVSHNLQAISTFCNKGIVLHKGAVQINAPIDNCIQNYFSLLKDDSFNFNENTSKKDRLNRTNGMVSFSKVISLMADGSENKMWSFSYNENIRFKFECKVNEPCEGLTFYMALKGVMVESLITNAKVNITSKNLKAGDIISFGFTIPAKNIRPGQYDLYFAIGNTDVTLWYDVIDNNVNLPTLIILPIDEDQHKNVGFFTIPFTIDEKNI
jgi:lipopolysaccharide transport system ATP-binding protein